jgi:hypothetical protein
MTLDDVGFALEVVDTILLVAAVRLAVRVELDRRRGEARRRPADPSNGQL